MSEKLLNILVDETPVKVGLGHTIMQTCAAVGIEIPRFCYHDKLLIAGNCRICLVEISGSKKLAAACAVHVTNNMVIYTNSIRVRLARQNVLEFLLANHPLDCPICDQGGECDLQDITSVFGADRGRFYEAEKRAVLNKDLGPLIRTSMNRCIHCTRCVRFLSLSSGFAVLGTLGRGSSTEISMYVNQFIGDELSGNITDLCPVGALTSKPYSFKARPWELTSVEGFDVLDTLHSHTWIDVVANRISRILPYSNEVLNECWLSNRARYAYDGLFVQRLANCLLRVGFSYFTCNFAQKGVSKFFIKLTWSSAIFVLLEKITSKRLALFAVGVGDSFDLESSFLAKTFFETVGAALFTVERVAATNADFNFLYLFNTSLVKLTKFPSFCLLIGTNTRLEAPLLNLRLNKLVNTYSTPVYRIAAAATYLAFKSRYVSNNVGTFFEIIEFKHLFCKNFYIPSFIVCPFILIGQGVLLKLGETPVVSSTLSFLTRLSAVSQLAALVAPALFEFSAFGVLSTYSSRIHAAEIGFNSGVCNSLNFNFFDTDIRTRYFSGTAIFYSLGLDYSSLKESLVVSADSNPVWVVYQGTHGNGVAGLAQLILPVLTYVESITFYKNLLGDVKKSNIAVSYDFSAKTNSEIFKLLFNAIQNQRLFRFVSLSFLLAVSFNWKLLLTQDYLLSSEFLLPWGGSTNLISGSLGCSASDPYYYVRRYTSFFTIKKSARSNHSFFKFYNALLPSQIVKFSALPSTSLILNYYGDPNTTLVGASRTMNLCSNLILKKNFSFNTLYY